MASRAGTACRVGMGYWAGPAQITGLRAMLGPRPRHVGRPGTAQISNRANHAGPNRAGPSWIQARPCRAVRMANCMLG
jgi:hypothetical protein